MILLPETGTVYGSLTVLGPTRGKSVSGHTQVFCRCACGAEKLVPVTDLRRGKTKSCGCLRRERCIERSTKHGLRKTRLYSIWTNMLNRCYLTSCKSYEYYGGRGITVCDEWKASFERFAADMGHPPSDQHTLDRRDNALGYNRSNCRWVTRDIQVNNKSNNIRVECNGETRTLAEWAVHLGMKYHTLRTRFRKNWSVERAFTTPVKERV